MEPETLESANLQWWTTTASQKATEAPLSHIKSCLQTSTNFSESSRQYQGMLAWSTKEAQMSAMSNRISNGGEKWGKCWRTNSKMRKVPMDDSLLNGCCWPSLVGAFDGSATDEALMASLPQTYSTILWNTDTNTNTKTNTIHSYLNTYFHCAF